MRKKNISTALRAATAILAVTLLATTGWAAKKKQFSFNGADGNNPLGGLVFDTAGNLYGATSQGGAYGYGTVFKLSHKAGVWSETVLHSFNNDGVDGWDPADIGGLIFDAFGNLYGTTAAGGTYGYGTAFVLKPAAGGNWTEALLYNFGTNSNDGQNPLAGLVFDAAGTNLYGTTISGGAYGGIPGDGTVFELSPAGDGTWKETVLHSFNGLSGDGYDPYAGVILDAAGNLYGTTPYGGANNYGLVFELTAASGAWVEIPLYSIAGADGIYPFGGVIFYGGSLYGTTQGLAALGGCGGTVFQLTPTLTPPWTMTVLNKNVGCEPTAGLVSDASGDLYGTTYGLICCNNGLANLGTVFQLTPAAATPWPKKVLHAFESTNNDGQNPLWAPLILDAAGNLYGTTSAGGDYGYGTVFKIIP